MWGIAVGPIVKLCLVLGHGTEKEILMRILALAILAIGMASATPPARAQTYDPNYPVCLQIYQSWKNYYFECAYTSLGQCNMSARYRRIRSNSPSSSGRFAGRPDSSDHTSGPEPAALPK